ncbi:hypothetical protein H0H93_005546 [Arthromyces matolae]|nr:hypothetical protein H0H93_005546 [Arthromyces matolae]
MSTPLRTKRNFKSLQLPVDDPLIPDPEPEQLPRRVSSLLTVSPPPPKRPLGPQPLPPKRRPPPLGADAAPVPSFLSPIVDSSVPSALRSSVNSGRHSALLHATLAKMELEPAAPVEITDLKNADLRDLKELGQGNGGSVMMVEHVPSGTVMAKKIVLVDAKPSVRKQILRELQIMHSCKSPYIISTYGAFASEPNICICMEYMDKGSFDGISKKLGAIDIRVVRQLAYVVLEGLMYLYDVHRIIHRDIKPSNILFNSKGEIKLIDFGVSGELINSIANTFVGTSIYMSPERIQGAEYSVKSDVWSLGISIIELALGRFPFALDDDDDYSDDDNDSDLERDALENPNTLTLGRTRTARRKTTKDTDVSPSDLSSSTGSGSGSNPNSNSDPTSGNSSGGGLGTLSIIELMHQIVREPAPRLNGRPARGTTGLRGRSNTVTINSSTIPSNPNNNLNPNPNNSNNRASQRISIIKTAEPQGEFAPYEEEFVDACLLKDPEERKTPKELLAFRWMTMARENTSQKMTNTLVAASASPMPEGVTNPNYKPLPGRLGNLTMLQLHALQKFKKELIEEGVFVEERMDDAFLLRYLRARKFDVAKAKEMLIAAEKWRQEFGADTIIEDFQFTELQEVNKYYPQYYHKTDKEGRPIYIERLGLLNIDALYKITTQERLVKRLVQEYEKFQIQRLPASCKAMGHPVETSCTILDLQNVSLTSFVRVKDYVFQASSIGQNRYPECMGKFYIINAPWTFSTVWRVIKPWLDEVTVSKVDILGSNYKETLLKQIPAENLPKEFGGSCSCPGGCSLSNAALPNVTDPNYKPLPGRLGNLTAEQEKALATFKEQLIAEGIFDPERMDDAFLLRFLRARKFDLVKSKEMLKAAEEWRKEEGVNDILETFDFKEKREVDKWYPQYYHKTDKDGRPIYIEIIGQVDITELYKVTTQDRQLKRLVWEYEKSAKQRFPACSKAFGHPVETSCTILDLAGISVSKFFHVKDYVSLASQISSDRYPETMGKFYIINAPWAFSTVWAMIKPWLDPVTVAKINILGSSYQDEVFKQIPRENLPKRFGGTCECPGGCSLSDAGPWVQ